MHKKALILSEVFWPEDFIINDLVDDWLAKGYSLEILTRNPSYPFGRVTDGYKNNLYNKSVYKNTFVHRFFVFPGYQNSLLIKILNYVTYMFICFWFLLFNGKKYDKIFIYQTGPLTNAFSPVLLKTIFRYKITIWSQDLWPDTIYAYGLKKTKIVHWFLTRLVSFIYAGCDTILVSCNGFKSKITEILQATNKPIYWIPNWPIINGFSNKKEKLPEGFNFTFAGNIGKVQNLDNIVEAFKNVAKKHDNVYLNIIGDGSFLNELKEICFNKNIENVNFTGRKPLVTMPRFFSASDVLLISLVDVPLYEIMIPSKFQTYLTAKKPIFSVMKGEVSNLVDKYNIGVTSNPSSIEDIEKGFLTFINESKQKLNEYAVKSQDLLDDKFDEQKTKKELISKFWNEN